jgi:hypothetical protein
MLRSPADEPFGMCLEYDIENGLPFRYKLGSLPIMNSCRCQQLQPGVVVLMVIPGEES